MKSKNHITIYDIAKRLKISPSTVSRALNNNPRVNEVTKKLIVETARQMNYKQNKLALALKSGNSMVVGVVVPFINRSFFSTIIRGIEEELKPLGYHVIICQTGGLASTEQENINALLDVQVDGIFLSTSTGRTEGKEHLNHILENDTPLILVDRSIEVVNASAVVIDDFKGAYEATKHLISQGCSKIVHFSGDRKFDIYENRFLGYSAALKDHGIALDPKKYVIQTGSVIENGSIGIKNLLRQKVEFDAVFSASDFAAIGAYLELEEQGIGIPDQVALVGFGNEPFIKYTRPSISSVDQSPLEMGKRAAQLFLNSLKQDVENPLFDKIVLPAVLHVRNSSKKGEL
ncbi:LacI family DNA-binding transcriptional regulator [Galbibacter sp.]|uniref:LacI family DNA-binding transcriptional regulator n=1 Tax=Galbibacter sp. TaxID=2918471 RepID=UPI003A954D11